MGQNRVCEKMRKKESEREKAMKEKKKKKKPPTNIERWAKTIKIEYKVENIYYSKSQYARFFHRGGIVPSNRNSSLTCSILLFHLSHFCSSLYKRQCRQFAVVVVEAFTWIGTPIFIIQRNFYPSHILTHTHIQTMLCSTTIVQA